MKNRKYGFIVVQSASGPLQRISLSRRTLIAGAWILGLAVVAVSAALIHGLSRWGVANESLQLARDNARLAAQLQKLQALLPKARVQADRTLFTYAQLYTKSGLETPSRRLGLGPVEADGWQRRAWEDPPGQNSASTDDHGFGTTEHPARQLYDDENPLDQAVVHLARHLARGAPRLQAMLTDTLTYLRDAEQRLANTPAIRPATTPWFTSSFGKRRDPIHGQWVMHKGLDLGGYVGMKVISPAEGVVIWTGYRGGYGKTVVLDHGYGLQTHFAHLSSFLVSLGDHVRRGDFIALMGNTGKSTGPHLHYEVRLHGRPLDPRRFILN